MGGGNDTLDASRLLNAVALDVRGGDGNDTVKLGRGGGQVVDLLGDNTLSALCRQRCRRDLHHRPGQRQAVWRPRQ
jgi:hypothetical protein